MNILYETIAETAGRRGTKPALICENEIITYAGLMRMVNDKAASISAKLRACTLPVRTDVGSVVDLLACAKRNICVLPLPMDIPHDEQEKLTHDTFKDMPDNPLPFLLLQTSGTTGDPKLIGLTQETKMLRAGQFSTLYMVEQDDVVLVGTPLHYSMPQRLVFTSLMVGAVARLLPKYSPELWLDQAVRCSVVVGVAQQLQHFHGKEPIKTRLVLNSSAHRSFCSDYRYCDCYGTSEIAIATNLHPLSPEARNVGIPVPGVEIKIDNAGEIMVRTPLLFSGYFNRQDLTAEAMTEDGFFRTGDAGYFDSNGYLNLNGRLNDVIKVGGIKVYPDRVEEVMTNMDGVVDCAAIGIYDDRLGETVHVVLVMEPDVRQPTIRDIQHATIGWLGQAAVPRSMSFADSLPRTPNGKLLRRNLK